MTQYPPGEGPITEEEAKAQAALDDEAAASDDVEPPEEPLEDAAPTEAITEGEER